MNTKFKRHDKVRLLIDPDPEYIEYHIENLNEMENPEIKKGMLGEINLILPNGEYHVAIYNDKGEIIAYALMPEESLEFAGE